jgi:hypothetical protein
MHQLGMNQSLRSPLKPGINPTFRGIVLQVLIFRLKRAKKAFSAEIFLWEWHSQQNLNNQSPSRTMETILTFRGMVVTVQNRIRNRFLRRSSEACKRWKFPGREHLQEKKVNPVP